MRALGRGGFRARKRSLVLGFPGVFGLWLSLGVLENPRPRPRSRSLCNWNRNPLHLGLHLRFDLQLNWSVWPMGTGGIGGQWDFQWQRSVVCLKLEVRVLAIGCEYKFCFCS